MKSPDCVNAEQAVLGCALMEIGSARHITQHLDSDDFYRPEHRLIYTAIEGILTRGDTPDTVILCGVVDVKKCGGYEYILKLTASLPSTVNLDSYVDAVKSASNTRKMEQICRQGLAHLGEHGYDVARAQMEKALLGIGESKAPWIDTATVLSRGQQKEKFLIGIDKLDRYTQGLRTGLNLFAGGPGAGKSTLCLQICHKIVRDGNDVCIMCDDQDPDEQAKILWCQLARKPEEELCEGEDWWKDHKTVTEYPIHWYDGRFTLPAVISEIRNQAARGVKFFFIDSLQSVTVGGQDFDWQKMEIVAKALKSTAKDLQVFLLVTCEFVKHNGKPTLSNLKGGTGVTHAAGQAWYLDAGEEEDKPAWAERKTNKPVQIVVLKNKMGGAGQGVTVNLMGDIHLFENT